MGTVRIVAAVILAIAAAGVADRQANPQTPGLAIGPEAALPRGVHPETRNRLSPLDPARLSDRMKKLYADAVAASPGGYPQGVAAIRLYRSGVDVRWDARIGRRLSELAIITIAREYDQVVAARDGSAGWDGSRPVSNR